MSSTSKQRQKRHIQKLKDNGLYDKYKETKAKQERNRRKRLKDGLKNIPKAKREKILKINREKSRQRVSRCRQRKKDRRNNQNSNTINVDEHYIESSYTSEAELMRDVEKVEKALPASPALRIAVLRELYQELFGNERLENTNNDLQYKDKVEPKKGIIDCRKCKIL